jgi:hypothetical protein
MEIRSEIMKYHNSMCISRDRFRRCLEIDQSGYIKDVLDRFGMADANLHHFPQVPMSTLLNFPHKQLRQTSNTTRAS